MKYIQKMLMLVVFTAIGMSVCKYAKYERVRCQKKISNVGSHDLGRTNEHIF